MDSLALASVPGLIGHPSKGPRAESHWLDLGHTTQLAALTQGVRLPLARPRSPTHERVRGGPAPPTTQTGVGGMLSQGKSQSATRGRKSRCWAGKKQRAPWTENEHFLISLSEPQRAVGLCNPIHFCIMLKQGEGFVNICGVNERINE